MAGDGLSKEEQEQTVLNYFGPVILGTVFGILLYGVNLSQFVSYLNSCKSDAWTTRSMVGALFAMCTVQAGLLAYTLWSFGVDNFGNYDVFLRESWSNTVCLSIVMSFIALTVQQYFLWRVKGFSQSWILFGALSFCSVVATALGLIVGFASLIPINPLTLDEELDLSQTTIIINVFVNVMNATLLLYFLLQYRTGFTRTDGVIRRLVVTCVESPLLNALFSLVDLIVFKVTFPSNWFIIAASPSGQVYAFSVLALLNSRTYLRHAWRGVTDIDTRHLSRFGPHFSSEPVRVGVTVEQHAQVAVDPFASCIRDNPRDQRHDGKRDHHITVESTIKSRHKDNHEMADFSLAVRTYNAAAKIDSGSNEPLVADVV